MTSRQNGTMNMIDLEGGPTGKVEWEERVTMDC